MTADTCWVVSLTYTTPTENVDEKQFEMISDRFGELDWEFAAGPALDMVVTVYLDHDQSAFDCMRRLHDRAENVLKEVGLFVMLVKCETMTEERREHEANAPQIPSLVGAGDVAELLEVSRQRVNQLHHQHNDFPSPVVQASCGNLWTQNSIERFARLWDRPGLRKKADANDHGHGSVVSFPQHRSGKMSDHDSAAEHPECCEA